MTRSDMTQIGDVISRPRVFTQAEFDEFARISGDDNPIHVDAAFSARTRFGRTVAHGMLLYSALWGLIHEHYPGAVQLEHSMMFPAPTYAGEPMELELEILSRPSERELRLAVRVKRAGDATLTLEGATTLQLRLAA